MEKSTGSSRASSEPGFGDDVSVKSTRSQYRQTSLGRFTRLPTLPNDFQLGDCLVDSVAVMLICPQHRTVALAHIPGKGHWFPTCPIKATQSFDEAVDVLLQQILFGTTPSETSTQAVCSKPQAIDHLRLQVPQHFHFVERILFFAEFTSAHSTVTQCCPGHLVRWFQLEDALQLTDLWGDEPALFLNINGQQPGFRLTEMTIGKVLAYLSESTEYASMLRACRLDEKTLIQLYGEFAQHCFPSQAMNSVSFVDYLTRSGIVPSMDLNQKRAYLRSFSLNALYISEAIYLSFREFLYGMAALGPECPHGGLIGLLRVGYIFRYYNLGTNENELDVNSICWLAHDLNLRDVTTLYEAFEIEPQRPVPRKTFERTIGTLKIRGTSKLLRWRPSPLELFQRHSIYRNIDQCQLSSVKAFCVRCRSKQYTLAAHTVTLTEDGRIARSQLLYMCADVKRMSQAARILSREIFLEDNYCNELMNLIRHYMKNPNGSSWSSKKGRLAVWPKLRKLCDEAKKELASESRVVSVTAPVYVLGDIHGNLTDLLIMEKLLWKTAPSSLSANYLFLGDYVDRGDNSVECITYLLCFKLLAPGRVTLLRGNHEVRAVQKQFTFYMECIEKFGQRLGNLIWEAFNEVFDVLPLCATIDGQIFCAHGGIPASVMHISQLNAKIPCPLSDPELQSPSAHEVLWNDPLSSRDFETNLTMLRTRGSLLRYPSGFLPNSKRGTAYYFSDTAVDAFLEANQLSHIIRGHEVIPDGFTFHSGGKVLTIFSCSKYCEMLNSAAVALVDGHSKIRLIGVCFP